MATPKLYVGVGHGMTPEGRYDPGAVMAPYAEHDLNYQVALAYAAAARRCGVDVVIDRDAGAGHDPNWVGSAAAANAWQADRADEVHHNAGRGSGAEVLVHPATTGANKAFAAGAAAGIAARLGLPDRGIVARPELGFLRATRMPAAIVEVCFLDHPADRAAIARAGYATLAGEALAAAAAGFLGVRYLPPAGPADGPVTPAHLRADLSVFYDTLVDGDPTHPVTLRRVWRQLVAIADRVGAPVVDP